MLCFFFQSIWGARIMVIFWLQLSDKVTFEEDYTAKIFFWTFHVNIFFILRNKRTTCKKNNCDILCYSVEKKCWILALKRELEEHRNVAQVVYNFLCRWWWEIKTKEDERKKKKEGILEGCFLFYFLLFCWFFSCLFILGNFLVQIWSFFFLYFEDLNGFEFLKFWIAHWKSPLKLSLHSNLLTVQDIFKTFFWILPWGQTWYKIVVKFKKCVALHKNFL